jgi:hypothetical protein
MSSEKPLVDRHFVLQKFPGKGGWTYATIPEIAQNPNNPFGWVKVRGFIDHYELKQYKLMPMGEGRLFLPIKAAIRKAIGKQAGDEVKISLFLDESSYQIPAELVECFSDEPKRIYENFRSFTEGEQKAYVDWIYAAKTDETKAQRILKMMERIKLGLRLHDQV